MADDNLLISALARGSARTGGDATLATLLAAGSKNSGAANALSNAIAAGRLEYLTDLQRQANEETRQLRDEERARQKQEQSEHDERERERLERRRLDQCDAWMDDVNEFVEQGRIEQALNLAERAVKECPEDYVRSKTGIPIRADHRIKLIRLYISNQSNYTKVLQHLPLLVDDLLAGDKKLWDVYGADFRELVLDTVSQWWGRYIQEAGRGGRSVEKWLAAIYVVLDELGCVNIESTNPGWGGVGIFARNAFKSELSRFQKFVDLKTEELRPITASLSAVEKEIQPSILRQAFGKSGSDLAYYASIAVCWPLLFIWRPDSVVLWVGLGIVAPIATPLTLVHKVRARDERLRLRKNSLVSQTQAILKEVKDVQDKALENSAFRRYISSAPKPSPVATASGNTAANASDSTRRYSLIFSGEVAPGFSKDAVLEKLSRIYSLSADRAAALFSGKPVTVKSTTFPADIAPHEKAFRDAGALVRITIT